VIRQGAGAVQRDCAENLGLFVTPATGRCRVRASPWPLPAWPSATLPRRRVQGLATAPIGRAGPTDPHQCNGPYRRRSAGSPPPSRYCGRCGPSSRSDGSDSSSSAASAGIA
jgi:hypothetical protein